MGLIFLIIWVVKPLGRPNWISRCGCSWASCSSASPWFHGDSAERLGLRLDNFWKATGRRPADLAARGRRRRSAPGTSGHRSIHPAMPRSNSRTTSLWAIAQQYALQSVILLRLEDSGLRGGAPLAAAALFSLVHAPNPGLLILTFLGGLLWCSTFRRTSEPVGRLRSSHAVLAVVVVSDAAARGDRQATGSARRIGPAEAGHYVPNPPHYGNNDDRTQRSLNTQRNILALRFPRALRVIVVVLRARGRRAGARARRRPRARAA